METQPNISLDNLLVENSSKSVKIFMSVIYKCQDFGRPLLDMNLKSLSFIAKPMCWKRWAFFYKKHRSYRELLVGVWVNPIPTGHGRNQPIYERQMVGIGFRGSEERMKIEMYHLVHQHFESYLWLCKICNSLDAFEFSYLFIPTKPPYFHHLFCICNFQNT